LLTYTNIKIIRSKLISLHIFIGDKKIEASFGRRKKKGFEEEKGKLVLSWVSRGIEGK